MITPREAVGLIQADYDGRLAAIERLDVAGCQAAIVAHGHRAEKPILLIRGSDERQDWLVDFDCRKRAAPGDTVLWHSGALRYAQIVCPFAKGKPLSAVIGHSLGAGVMQIVATSLGLPGIGFAGMRALYAPAGAPRPANEHLVTLYNRQDDLVCYLPDSPLHILRMLRDLLTPGPPAQPDCFTWAGTSHWLIPPRRHVGIDHHLVHYLPLLQDVAPPDINAAAAP